MKTLSFVVNGQRRTVDVEPRETLLEVLRERLGIKSPKVGCERGDCGACTVLLNGLPVRSCLILALEVEGQEVTTVEGLQAKGLTPLQQAFVHRNAFQCGYCAPGITLAATALLKRNPHPTRREAQEALSGNLCRCTGYAAILDAIVEAGRQRKAR